VDVVLASGANQAHLPWFRMLKGMAEYRQGHLESAIEWLDQALRSMDVDFSASRATALLFLAMSHHRLGHAEQARGALTDARALMEHGFPKAGVDDLDVGPLEDWLICHVIRREAETLFEGG
jgi:ATP/maltotriose-dependent transcriptional regulator MalT